MGGHNFVIDYPRMLAHSGNDVSIINMKKYFITATGTNIGKTFVTAALAHQLTEAGYVVEAKKPIISGYEDGGVNDTEILLKAQNAKINQKNISICSPLRFRAATSPDYAAKLENRKIELPKLQEICQPQGEADYFLVEGVGGIMVPFNKDKTILDLIIALNMPVILVTGSYLGSINHTLTTLEVLKANKIKDVKIVISESAENPMPLQETAETIARFTEHNIMVLPYCQSGDYREAADITKLII